MGIRHLQAGCALYRAVDIDHDAACTANKVVVVVIHPVLVTSRRARRLDPPDEAPVGQCAEGVVHRLARDGTDLGPHQILDLVRRAVRSAGHRTENGQTLRRHLNTMLTQQECWDGQIFPRPDYSVNPMLDSVKTWLSTWIRF